MGLPPLVADTTQPQKKLPSGMKRLHRWPTLLLIVLVAVGAATAWQTLLNRQPNVPVAGRPLSSAQTHLHTVAIVGK